MVRARPADPGCLARQLGAQNRHARDHERDLGPAADQLSLAASAAQWLPAALNGLQRFPDGPGERDLGGHLAGGARHIP